MVGRLKVGTSVAVAQQQIDALNARNLERFPSFKQILINAGFHTVVAPLQQDLVREVRPTLLMLWAGVLFVLAIGAVNITNLVLIRSSARMRELATRHALGASLPRLIRYLMTETVLLTSAGGVLGLGIGYLALTALGGVGLDALPRANEVRMNPQVIGFASRSLWLVGVVVGLAPVARLSRAEPRAGVPRRRTQRHRGAWHAPGRSSARRQPGGVCVHAARWRGSAAHELSARVWPSRPGSILPIF